MTTKKVLTKEQILEALKKNKITDLEQFIEALLPRETGGYGFSWMGLNEEETDWFRKLKEAYLDFTSDP